MGTKKDGFAADDKYPKSQLSMMAYLSVDSRVISITHHDRWGFIE